MRFIGRKTETYTVTIQLLPHEQVAAFFAWRGGNNGGTCLAAALDKDIRQFLEGERWIFLALDDNGEWIGTVSLASKHDDPELADGQMRVYLQALEVVEVWRRRGVGTRLTQHVLDVAREKGWTVVTLAVEPSATEAKALYHKMGFEEFKTSHFAWDGEMLPVECLMKRLLPAELGVV